MTLSDILHANTRSGWTLRLIAYVALIVTICAVLQFLNVFVIE